MYQIKIRKCNGEIEEIKDIHDITWGENYAFFCLKDLKTRLVRPLSEIESYILKGQPTVNKK